MKWRPISEAVFDWKWKLLWFTDGERFSKGRMCEDGRWHDTKGLVFDPQPTHFRVIAGPGEQPESDAEPFAWAVHEDCRHECELEYSLHESEAFAITRAQDVSDYCGEDVDIIPLIPDWSHVTAIAAAQPGKETRDGE